jgi:hypothetical protein
LQADDPALGELLTFPSPDEGIPNLDHLRSMHPRAIANLARLGDDEVSSREAGISVGLPLNPKSDYWFTETVLMEQALVEPAAKLDDRKWFRLTDKGRKLARLLIAEGEVPDWLVLPFHSER